MRTLISEEQSNPEKEHYLYQGSRELTKDQIKHLIITLNPIFKSSIHNNIKLEATHLLAEMLLREEISFETSLEIWGYLNSDVEILKEVYNKPAPAESLRLFEVIQDEINKKKSITIEKEVKKTIEKPPYYGNRFKQLGNDTYVILDTKNKQTLHEKRRYDRKGNPDPSTTIVLEVCLKDLTVYDSPISEEPRQFKATFDVKGGIRPLTIGPCFREEIITSLKDNNFIASKRYGEDVISASLNLFAQDGLAEMKTDIETPGFFYNNETGEIVCAKYEVELPDSEEIKQGFKVLKEFASYFKGVETKVGTIFKYGLVAPFAFAKKQMGAKWIPWYFLYGQAASGKSRLGQMVLYMWNEPDDGENNIGGGSFDTEARIGGAVSKFTFPIVVDEPAGVFAKEGLIEIIKNAVFKKVLRSRYKAGHLGTIPSYSPVIFTSNVSSPQDIAFGRRIETMSFNHDEMKTQEQMDTFDDIFQMDSPKRSKLNALKAITQAAALEIMADPKLLELDWKDLANTLLMRIYSDIGEKPPEWIMEWVKTETIEDIENEQRESIRILISTALNHEMKKVPLVDDEYRPTTLDSPQTVRENKGFNNRVWHVINEGYIPWAVPFYDSRKDKNYVCLTIYFKKELQKELKICQTLKGISQLMGWDYKSVRLPEPEKVIKIEFNKFVEMVYRRGIKNDQTL